MYYIEFPDEKFLLKYKITTGKDFKLDKTNGVCEIDISPSLNLVLVDTSSNGRHTMNIFQIRKFMGTHIIHNIHTNKLITFAKTIDKIFIARVGVYAKSLDKCFKSVRCSQINNGTSNEYYISYSKLYYNNIRIEDFSSDDVIIAISEDGRSLITSRFLGFKFNDVNDDGISPTHAKYKLKCFRTSKFVCCKEVHVKMCEDNHELSIINDFIRRCFNNDLCKTD